ncbi:hypothetical protein MGN70_006638 [Eutypa lata]|nr:hypothetical protein MGN70_006638 [Eutypa lata]
MANSRANSPPSMPADPQVPVLPTQKPMIVGIYGIPGCGKSYLLTQLKCELNAIGFKFYEGSEKIGSLVPGGLRAFQKLDESAKNQWRQQAMDSIANECATAEIEGTVGVIVGHFMFWDEGEETARVAWTQSDAEKYTHIIYLNIDPAIVSTRRLEDVKRKRQLASVKHLGKWQEAERTQLRQICRENGILFFSLAFSEPEVLGTVSELLRDFQRHTEEWNLSRAKNDLDHWVKGQNRHTILVFDADRTLTAEDTGRLFWQAASKRHPKVANDSVLRELFSGPLGYTYTAFRQAVLLYEEIFSVDEFDQLCEEVASAVLVRHEFHWLLQQVKEQQGVGAVAITCGLQRIWDMIFQKEFMADTVRIIGGGRIGDLYVITPEVKASLVLHLRTAHKLYVWAFGDSPMDLPMLSQADEAIVVAGEPELRSKSMDSALLKAIDGGGLRARQVLIPCDTPSFLDTNILPSVDLFNQEFVNSAIFPPPYNTSPSFKMLHATRRSSAKLLATHMRDATVTGPSLRAAHRNAGWYLATEFLAEAIGLENYPVTHVQGTSTSGYRLYKEEKTLIVPLMRGGEPMAFGVNQVFPLARFVHASRPEDVTIHHLQSIHNVILVDSVVNSGRSVVEFAQHVRNLRPTTHVIVVTGVVQKQSISEGGLIHEYGRGAELELIALRISENKFIGRGGTDTGNRLFNTTNLV